jgi:putative lipoprotein
VRRLLALSVVLSLAACAGGKKPPAGAGAPGTSEAAPAPPLAAPAPEVSPRPAAAGPLATLTGTVTYRQRIALTPEAVVQVELRDVSRQDAEAPLVARRIIEKPGQVPIPFSLDYDAGGLDPRHVYAVSARITDRGQLQFITDTRFPVITSGAPSTADIVVVPVR